MKRLILLTLLFSTVGIVKSQDATIIYKNTVNSTVTIETSNGFGSGFFVGKNIIATNYHVIKGATRAVCYSNNSTSKFEVEAILAADKTTDLVLLKVTGLNKPSIKMAELSVSPGQKVFVIGSPRGLPATISDGIVSGLREFEGFSLIQITAPISSGSSGGPVLNANGELIGVSVGQYADGQNLNFAIPISKLKTLLKTLRTYPISFNSPEESSINLDLNTNNNSNVFQNIENQKNNDKIYEIGILRSGDKRLSLDYISNVGKSSTFFFTYKQKNTSQLSQKIWAEDFSLEDLETGKIYYSKSTNLPKKDNPRVIYNGTKTHFVVCFDRLPSTVKRFNLREGDRSGNSFSFSNVDLTKFSTTTKLDVDLYFKAANEGSVTFYANGKITGKVEIYIEGYHFGSITQYFTNSNYVPECGDNTNASLTLRLPAGNYNFTATSYDSKWKGEITITANGCVVQGLSGEKSKSNYL